MPRGKSAKPNPQAADYVHSEASGKLRPEAGVQAQFTKRKGPKSYRFDSSLDPELVWDEHPARAEAEEQIAAILSATTLEEAQAAGEKLRRMSGPFLNWTGKAEQPEMTVPSLPLFVHERLSTQAIIQTLKGHRRDIKDGAQASLFGDPQHSVTDQLLRSYEHEAPWVNRLILGDSLAVMNSLLEYEGLAGKVQMVYMDPPYGVKFGSNFQPFVRKRDVKHNDDADISREPEMVKAYRDTWELGLHSYLTYLRERMLLMRSLLTASGSIFVQISDENVHHVRELMEEVFGAENFVVSFLVKKKGSQKGTLIDPVNDYLLWFARSLEHLRPKYKQLFEKMELSSELVQTFRLLEFPDGSEKTIVELAKETEVDYQREPRRILVDWPGVRIFKSENATAGGFRKNQSVKFVFRGKEYDPGIAKGNCWKHTAQAEEGKISGMQKLADANRLYVGDKQLGLKRFLDDFGYSEISNWWDGLGGASNPVYVVQTNAEIVKRCILMTTDPGDLVFDPTCGSGTTAYVAEQWGRRWITCDVSRVPLALARQRLLTATFDWYALREPQRGPAGGFVYQRKQNRKGEEVGGIVPHITSSTIANDEPPEEEVLVDRPETDSGFVRVSGPFCIEAVIPTPLDLDMDADGTPDIQQPGHKAAQEYGSYIERMLAVLRASPVIKLPGGKSIELSGIKPAAGLYLHGEAQMGTNGNVSNVGIVFGPESSMVSEMLAHSANSEAYAAGCTRLLVFGFAFEAKAREYLAECGRQIRGVEAHAVEMTPDLAMYDLLKNMRSSQLFSVAGQPDFELLRHTREGAEGLELYRVKVLGLDTINPETMDHNALDGANLPAWLLDTDYNGRVFHVCQAFFPRTGAWDSLKRALRAEYDESVWAHLSSTVSSPFEAGEHRQVAVKVIDDRGNELIAMRSVDRAVWPGEQKNGNGEHA